MVIWILVGTACELVLVSMKDAVLLTDALPEACFYSTYVIHVCLHTHAHTLLYVCMYTVPTTKTFRITLRISSSVRLK
jgi:hypothetical protein